MSSYDPKHVSLDGLESEIFKLVSATVAPAEWIAWLHVPLKQAAARGNLSLFSALVEAGADGRAGRRGADGCTLLEAAATGGNVELISRLLGSQPNAGALVSPKGRRSPLFTATACGHEEAALRLIAAGADVNFVDPVEKCSVLHEAARGGLGELAEFLVMNGANLGARDEEDGGTPLHVAADEGFDGIAEALLQRGAEKDALDHEGCTPLMGASMRGHAPVVKTLLAAGANLSVRNRVRGLTALDIAAAEGHVGVIEVIVDHGADIDDYDDDGVTALRRAAQEDQVGAVDALIEAGADIDLKDDLGWTPFTEAAYFNNCKAMLALLQHGAKLDTRDNNGDTALHLACAVKRNGLEMAVGLLLRCGADETAANNYGQIPSKMLDLTPFGVLTAEHDGGAATDDEIERTRMLLSRAPADRAWRRRGWLVVLRSRKKQTRASVGCDNDRDVKDGAGTGGGQPEGDGRGGGNVGTGVGAGGFWSGIAALLVELGPEGVFRTVVGFL